MTEQAANGPGRPAGDQRDVRAELVAVARQAFAERGFEAVPLREIGERAGVTPAMVRYYFGGKTGLYEAVLEAASAPLFERLTAARADAGIDELIGAIAGAYGEMASRDPWLPPLVVREVFLPEGRLRQRFVERFAGRVAPLVEDALETARLRGELREETDSKAAALALVSLGVFPHLARPVVTEVFGFDPSGADRGRIEAQIRAIYLDGVRRRAEDA